MKTSLAGTKLLLKTTLRHDFRSFAPWIAITTTLSASSVLLYPWVFPDAATLRNLEPDPWSLRGDATRPLRAAGAVLADLADLGMDAEWIGLPGSLVGAPHPRIRIFILAWRSVPDAARDRLDPRWRITGPSTGEARSDCTLTLDHRSGTQRTSWLSEQERRSGDTVEPDRGHLHRWGRYTHAIARWENVTGRPAPAPALLSADTGPRPSPAFVEWLMGLPDGWVSNAVHGLTPNQQITALGNGVLPLQASLAVRSMLRGHVVGAA